MTYKYLKKKLVSIIIIAYPSSYIIKINDNKDNNQGKADIQARFRLFAYPVARKMTNCTPLVLFRPSDFLYN